MADRISLAIRTRAPVRLRIGRHDADEAYEGPYEVTPTRSEQYLATKSLLMRDDVTVHEIPYFETTNPYGTTYVIGE